MAELNRVAQWNERFGNDGTYKEIHSPELTAQLSFITEEYKELMQAVEDNDRTEVVDACGDILVVVAGYLHRMGYNPEHVLSVVNDSNFSKAVNVNNELEIRQTAEKYENDDRYDNITIDEYGVVRGRVVETGSSKVLKSIRYEGPKWKFLDRNLSNK